MAFGFEQQHKDIAGRIGRLRVGTKVVRTPALLPAINPHLQIVTPAEMHAMGVEALITNAYIFYRSDRFRDAALERGLHAVLDFPGVIMTDSGLFQLSVYGDVELGNRETLAFQQTDWLGDCRPARHPDAADGRPRDGPGRGRDDARPDRRGPGIRRRRCAPRGPGPGRALRGPARGGRPGRERRRRRDRPDWRRRAADGELPLPRPRPGRARGQAGALPRRLRPPLRRRPPGHARPRRRDGVRPLRLGGVRALREGGPVPDRPRDPRARRGRRPPLLLRGLPFPLGRRLPRLPRAGAAARAPQPRGDPRRDCANPPGDPGRDPLGVRGRALPVPPPAPRRLPRAPRASPALEASDRSTKRRFFYRGDESCRRTEVVRYHRDLARFALAGRVLVRSRTGPSPGTTVASASARRSAGTPPGSPRPSRSGSARSRPGTKRWSGRGARGSRPSRGRTPARPSRSAAGRGGPRSLRRHFPGRRCSPMRIEIRARDGLARGGTLVHGDLSLPSPAAVEVATLFPTLGLRAHENVPLAANETFVRAWLVPGEEPHAVHPAHDGPVPPAGAALMVANWHTALADPGACVRYLVALKERLPPTPHGTPRQPPCPRTRPCLPGPGSTSSTTRDRTSPRPGAASSCPRASFPPTRSRAGSAPAPGAPRAPSPSTTGSPSMPSSRSSGASSTRAGSVTWSMPGAASTRTPSPSCACSTAGTRSSSAGLP